METLFEVKYRNTQPLRTLEPLIRFDLDGRPQPKQAIDAAEIIKALESSTRIESKQMEKIEPTKVQENLPVENKHESTPKVTSEQPVKKPVESNKPTNDLKRKLEVPNKSNEPQAKKQQTSIMSFFKKRD